MKRIAKFEKVSLTQFKAGCTREDAEKVYEGIKLPKRATAGSASVREGDRVSGGRSFSDGSYAFALLQLRLYKRRIYGWKGSY